MLLLPLRLLLLLCALGCTLQYDALQTMLQELSSELELSPPARHSSALRRGSLIAHAGGALDGAIYSNSVPAMRHWYARGVRLFELDLNALADGSLVCAHGGKEDSYVREDGRTLKQVWGSFGAVPSTAEFEQFQFWPHPRRGPPLQVQTLETVLDRMLTTLPDVHLILDLSTSQTEKGPNGVVNWRDQDVQSFGDLLSKGKYTAHRRKLVSRIIPELHRTGVDYAGGATGYRLPSGQLGGDWAQIAQLEKRLKLQFPLKIQQDETGLQPIDMLAYVRHTNVAAVSYDAASGKLSSAMAKDAHMDGRLLMTYTVNKFEELKKWAHKGVDVFYTDSYSPSEKFLSLFREQ